MARKSSNLGGLATVHTKSISIDSKEAFWKPLGKDSKTEDGLNPHFVLVDEYHAHPDASMLEVMDSALGSRTQPLLWIITTAGFRSECACKEERDYAIRVLEGVIEDDSYFANIYTWKVTR
jgi:phage terminase large subunit-like protein